MQLQLEKKLLYQSRSPDRLQLLVARQLVNSDAWAAELDRFLSEPNRTRLPAIKNTICKLTQRNHSESEIDCFLIALEERYVSLNNIQTIKNSFSIPADEKIDIKLKNNSQIDLSKTLEPFKRHFTPEIGMPQKFKILLDLDFKDIAQEWLEKVYADKDYTADYFQKNIFETFCFAIQADFQVTPGMINTVNAIEDYTEQFFYIQVFLRLIEKNSAYNKITSIWRMIKEEFKTEVMLEAVGVVSNIEKLWGYAICLFPEDWQYQESYIKLFVTFFIKAAQSPNRYRSFIRTLTNLAADNPGLLYSALQQINKQFPASFSDLISVLILDLENNVLDIFFCENLFLFFPQLVLENYIEVIKILFAKLADIHIIEMIRWLNENDNYFFYTQEMAYFILPKLTQENQQKIIIKSILINLDDFGLVNYLFQKTDERSKEIIKESYDKKTVNLYDKIWHVFIIKFTVQEFVSDVERSIRHMFGSDDAVHCIKRFNPIITMNSLLRRNVSGFMNAWMEINQESRNELCGPILYFFFYYLEKEDFNLIDFILETISAEQNHLVESEIKLLKKNIISKKSFIYWIEKQASVDFIVSLERNEICSLIGSKRATVALTCKILDALDEHQQLDKLELSSQEDYADLVSRGKAVFVIPYLMKGLLQPLPMNLSKLISNDVFLVLNSSLEGCFTTSAFNKLISEYARAISELVFASDLVGLSKLHYFSSQMIIVNKKIPNNKAQAFAELIKKLLSNRVHNPLLEAKNKSLQRFFIMKNPVDGNICRSDFEKNLVLIYTEMQKLYPQFIDSEIIVQEQELSTP